MRMNHALLATAALGLAAFEMKDDATTTEQLGFDIELKFAGDDAEAAGRIDGYGAVFNLMDNGGDIIMPGAFKATLADWKRRKSMPPMLWQHKQSDPIGCWTELEEDEKGLKSGGNLIMEVPQAGIARALIKGGAVKGMSIGYITRDADIDRKTGVRFIKKLDLYEISLVTIPMNPAAGVTSVKGDFLLLSDREQERFYRDGGLSQREAKIAVAVNKKMAPREEERPDATHCEGAGEAITTIRRATALFG